MYKKITALIIGILIIGLVGLGSKSHSKYTNPTTCLEAYINEMGTMRSAWNTNLKSIMEQEKPTSEMVDEAFESMRTYRCWLDYLCEAVLFSGNANANKVAGEILTKNHLNTIPGCVAPSNITIPTTKLKYIPQCQVTSANSGKPTIEESVKNYNKCKEFVALEFYADPQEKKGKIAASSNAINAFKERSAAYVSLERQLKENSVAQKSRILKSKLSSIVTKMQSMEKNMVYLNNYMHRFDSLLPCVAAVCD